jgi:hypothetical protein
MREFPVDCVPQQASGLPPDKDIEKWQWEILSCFYQESDVWMDAAEMSVSGTSLIPPCHGAK